MTCVLDDVEQIPVSISDEQHPHYFLNIIICCTCNICPRAVEQATEIYEAKAGENLSSGFPTKRVSNQSHQLNRLTRKLKFHL